MNAINNFNVLPFYTSLAKQNGKKWYAFGNIYPLASPRDKILPFQIVMASTVASVSALAIHNYKTGATIASGLTPTIYTPEGQSYSIIYLKLSTISQLAEGRYYLTITVDGTTLYSEIFNAISDLSEYVKIEYWNEDDLYTKDKIQVYFGDDFKFVMYACTDIGKPEYLFEEELTKRLGYKFLESQVSNKVYKFTFLAPEYLTDSMRIIRLSDYIKLTQGDEEFNALTFVYDAKWEQQGDLASVECEFETDTIIQKLQSFNRRQQQSFYNALLSNIDEPILFDTEVVAQYYADFQTGGLIQGKLIHELELETELKPGAFIPIDNNDGTPAKKISVTALNSSSHTHANKALLDLINQGLSKDSDVEFNNLLSNGAVVAKSLAPTDVNEWPQAGTGVDGVIKYDGTTLGRNAQGQLAVIGGLGTSVAWGTEVAGQSVQLIVSDVTKTLSLFGHTHNYQPLDDDLTAIAALAGTSGLLKKTALNTWELVTTYTADTLTTPRAINVSVSGIEGTAQNFDGSAPITIPVTLKTLTRGAYLTGNNYNGGADTTWAVDATNLNTASKVVARDANGDFSMRDLSLRNGYAEGALVAKYLSSTYSQDWPIAGTSVYGTIKYDPATLSLNGSGQLTVIGGLGTSVAWGTEVANQSVQLIVAAVTKTLSLSTHTHSNYLTAITKSMVEAVLTGEITTHTHALDADLTAIAALTGTTGLLKKTALNTWALDTSAYLTAITKTMVEAVLTGNITTHTHSQYLLSSAYTAADVLSKLLTVDGSGSGLDADMLDGRHGSFYFNRNTLFNANNVDYNAVPYEIGHGVTTQPIHLPNYTGATNAPFNSYGQMIHFDGDNFFPFRIAFDYAGRMFFQGAGYKPNGPYNYSAGTAWFEFYHSGNSNKKTVNWNAKDLSAVNGYYDGAVVAKYLSSTYSQDWPIAGTSVYGTIKYDPATLSLNGSGQLTVIGGGWSNVAWGTVTGQYAQLTVDSVTRNLSVDGHTHSYLPLSGGTLTGAIKINDTSGLAGTLVLKHSSVDTSEGQQAFVIYAGSSDTKLQMGAIPTIGSYIQSMRQGADWTSRPLIFQPNGGNVLIGLETNYGYKLDVNGTFRAIGAGYFNSTLDVTTSVTSPSFIGNASTATKLNSVRTFALTGDVAGSITSDLASGVSIATTIQPNSVALGTDTTGNYAGSVLVSGNGLSITGVAGEGTAFTVVSNATSNNTASTIMFRDSNGDYRARNGLHDGNVVAKYLSASYTVDWPVMTASVLGVAKAGLSLIATAGVLDQRRRHYTTVSAYTDAAGRDITAKIALGTGNMTSGTLDQIQLSFAPLTTTFGLNGNIVITATGAGAGLIVSFREDAGTGRWYVCIYNPTGATVVRDGIYINISCKQNV